VPISMAPYPEAESGVAAGPACTRRSYACAARAALDAASACSASSFCAIVAPPLAASPAPRRAPFPVLAGASARPGQAPAHALHVTSCIPETPTRAGALAANMPTARAAHAERSSVRTPGLPRDGRAQRRAVSRPRAPGAAHSSVRAAATRARTARQQRRLERPGGGQRAKGRRVAPCARAAAPLGGRLPQAVHVRLARGLLGRRGDCEDVLCPRATRLSQGAAHC